MTGTRELFQFRAFGKEPRLGIHWISPINLVAVILARAGLDLVT